MVAKFIDTELKPGEKVGIFGINYIYWVVYCSLAMKLGTLAVPFATILTPEQVTWIEADIQCKKRATEYQRIAPFGL